MTYQIRNERGVFVSYIDEEPAITSPTEELCRMWTNKLLEEGTLESYEKEEKEEWMTSHLMK